MNDDLGGSGADHFGKGWQDTMTVLCATFMVMVGLMMAHINDKARASQDSAEITSPGSVIITADWPPGLDTDVDLWVQGPGDVPVGYSNKGGGLFNLLRDDLGHIIDVSKINAEISFSRGCLPGLYVANVHLYRNTSGVYPVPVTIGAAVRADETTARPIVSQELQLKREGQELTGFRFRLDGDCKLVPGSVDSLQTDLRSAKVK